MVAAVKPKLVAETLTGAVDSLAPDTLVISIAAGVRIATLEAAAPGRPVVRAMPNTPALIGLAATAISGGSHATEEHLGRAETVLRALGLVVRVPEDQLDAVTGLSGSGPAYVFLLAEAMIAAGVRAGLHVPCEARAIRRQSTDPDNHRIATVLRYSRGFSESRQRRSTDTCQNSPISRWTSCAPRSRSGTPN